MKIWQKSASMAVMVTVVMLFMGFPLISQAGDKGPIKEVVFVHYKLPPRLDFQKGKRVAQCTVTQNDSINDWGAAGWHMPLGGLTYNINFNTLPGNISNGAFQDTITASTATWHAADIGASWTYGGSTSVRRSQLDGINLITFGSASGAIAITRTWYYVNTGEVVESDITLSSNLAWSTTAPSSDCGGVAGTYDVQNIATHELGHQVGLIDLYGSADRDLTMYGYGTTTELKKDSLGAGDTNGAIGVTP